MNKALRRGLGLPQVYKKENPNEKGVFLFIVSRPLSDRAFWSTGRTAATISGVVTDPSGAVVPKREGNRHQRCYGISTSWTRTRSGFYSISNLEPGPYRLDVAVAGFQSYEQTGIVLQVGAEFTVNVSLKVGSATEKVTVTGAAPLVNTRDQTVSTAITPQFTEQLPLNGRNILQLMSLAPDHQ